MSCKKHFRLVFSWFYDIFSFFNGQISELVSQSWLGYIIFSEEWLESRQKKKRGVQDISKYCYVSLVPSIAMNH